MADKEMQAVLKEMYSIVGFEEVKSTIRQLVEDINGPIGHFVFIGNHSTNNAQIAVARILGKLFKAEEFFESGHVVEASRENLVEENTGQSALKMQAMCDKALEGILFIHDAYNLSDDTFGREAIDTLLKCVEDYRGKFAIIIAGEKEPMYKWADADPRLPDRFFEVFNFVE